jgi:hypothetical protein
MISIDWQQVWGYLLVGTSGLGALIWGGKAAWTKFRSGNGDAPVRKADDPAPAGAVEWVEDITAAMSGASADTILRSLRDGHSRDVAMGVRISELEAKP